MKIKPAAAALLINAAFLTAKDENPDVDVFRRRRGSDPLLSHFHASDDITVEKLMPRIAEAKAVSVDLPDTDTMTVTVECQSTPSGIGERVDIFVNADKEYTIKDDEGRLAISGPVAFLSTPTDVVTAVLKRKDEKSEWTLTCLHPGGTEYTGDWSGLKAGDVIKGSDVDNRKLGRACQ